MKMVIYAHKQTHSGLYNPKGQTYQPPLVSREEWRCWKVDQSEVLLHPKGIVKVN